MKVSIIIPTYNHLDDCLKPCVESIIKYTDLTNTEVIISANGCTDKTKEYVESLGSPFKLLWSEKATGFSKAVNDGIEASTGDYLILLNNDTILLEQPKNQWVDVLTSPFSQDDKVGLTGPLMGPSAPADRNFLIFFCVCIKREVIEKIGLLDLVFTPGGGEDTDFCIRAEDAGYKLLQVPSQSQLDFKENFMVGNFPIYHKGEATVHDPKCVTGWQQIFDRNSAILANRYNRKWKLSNNFERAVIGKDDPVPPRERTRYAWARKNLIGTKILEIGCSSGYGTRFLKGMEDLDYLGIDYDKAIVEYAQENFGTKNIKFTQADINKFQFEQYDTIIAFEVLEHLGNGKELAQELKKYCKCLLTTVPFKEIPGLWGHHHKLHNLSELDFPGFEIKYVRLNGELEDTPDQWNGMNLLLMKWAEGMAIPKVKEIKESLEKGVTAIVSTKDRYHTSLPQCLISIANQTIKPKHIIIYDDGEQKDLREDPFYKDLFVMLSQRGIGWEVKFGERKGQVRNHQRSISDVKTEWIWRMDDDNIAEPDVLEKLLKSATPEVGAIGGLVLDPKIGIPTHSLASSKIEDIYLGLNSQWFRFKGIHEVDHLYSTFIYRKEAARHGYCLALSRVGHREETIFTYEMKRNGWKLLVDPTAVTWHFRNSNGGIRSDSVQQMWADDEHIFSKKLAEWKVQPNFIKLVVLDSGLGDHLAFKQILPELKAKHKNIVMAVCYPQVFEDEKDIKLISIAEAQMLGNLDQFNIYKWLWDNDWKESIVEAYRKMYL